MSRFGRFLILAALFQVTACDIAAERKAREEAAINAGNLRATAAGTETAKVPDAAVKAAAAESAATAPDHPAFAALPPQVDVTSEARAEIKGVVEDIECRPDISGEECATAKASLAGDLHSLLDDKIELCAQARARIESAQQKLLSQSTDLNADLDAIVEEAARSRNWFVANCTR